MNRLPIELISYIFTLGCDVAGFHAFVHSRVQSWSRYPLRKIEDHDPSWDRYRVTITSVCKTWRGIACSTAELWSFLEIRCMRARSDTPSHFAKLCLKHSKSKPLDIFLYGAETIGIMNLWEAITPALPRCRSLHLIIPSEAFYFVTPLPKDLSLLEEATITADLSGYDSGVWSTAIFQSPSHLPRLRRLRCRDLHDLILTSAPLEGLHEFAFESHKTFDPSILTRLRNARHLVLNCRFARAVDFKPLDLPQLKSIEFSDEAIVDVIRAPNLIHLKTPVMSFAPMLKPNTFPSARELELRNSGLLVWSTNWQPLHSEVTLQHQFMPSVEVFRLPPQDINTWRITLSMLLGPDTAGIGRRSSFHPPSRLFPSLRTLYCEKVGGYRIANTAFPRHDDPQFDTIHQPLDKLLIQLLRQRPLLSVVLADAIVTPARMDALAPDLRGRIANSDKTLGGGRL
ncbi:hypothetical protein DL93DRAFT_2171483 [Clavulina sp. PMI_390]|nr:hypothetical protein DL93DRAFT_2171483 [Clavulina sp. PMI_390]